LIAAGSTQTQRSKSKRKTVIMDGKTALVTGSGRGIGRAIALGLAQADIDCAVVARSGDELEAVVEEGRALGRKMIAIEADLADSQAPQQIVDTVNRELGTVDILVNNAGIASSQDPRPIIDFDDAFWDLSFRVNVTAPYLLTKRVLPGMMKQKWGRIINIASVHGKTANIHSAAYAASKHALIGLTKVTALEVAEFGITANSICPATTRSRLNDKRLQHDSERTGIAFEELERRSTPLGRRLEPEEIAALAVFLAGSGAAAINGQSINVCGGKVLF
jgi:3-hydroxybutyrate dehydrogenase